jgi:glycine cleavage system H protein
MSVHSKTASTPLGGAEFLDTAVAKLDTDANLSQTSGLALGADTPRVAAAEKPHTSSPAPSHRAASITYGQPTTFKDRLGPGTRLALVGDQKEVGTMTVLLVLATFAAFVLIDWFLRRRAPVRLRPERVAIPPAVEPVWVAGYLTPEELHYHRGHTWARVVGHDTVLVGLDDFARRLLGAARRLRLPATGSWLRQGEPGFSVEVDGRAADLVSPVAGEVLAVNTDLEANPRLATDDPYGRGWLLKVRAGDLAAELRNLFSGSLARRFMEDAREGLDHRLMALSGSVLQDGGEPVADFALRLPEADWRRLVGDFLLT